MAPFGVVDAMVGTRILARSGLDSFILLFLSERHTIQIQQYVVRYETGCKYREELIVTGPWSVAAPSHSE